MEKKENSVKKEKKVTFEDIFVALVKRVGNTLRYKSLRRRLKRGTINPLTGQSMKRPYNNRKPTKGRKLNEFKKKEYAKLKAKSK